MDAHDCLQEEENLEGAPTAYSPDVSIEIARIASRYRVKVTDEVASPEFVREYMDKSKAECTPCVLRKG